MLNVGTMRGGRDVSSVPAEAAFMLDLRTTVPGSHVASKQRFADLLGPGTRLPSPTEPG